jgi:hypothetical protein
MYKQKNSFFALVKHHNLLSVTAQNINVDIQDCTAGIFVADFVDMSAEHLESEMPILDCDHVEDSTTAGVATTATTILSTTTFEHHGTDEPPKIVGAVKGGDVSCSTDLTAIAVIMSEHQSTPVNEVGVDGGGEKGAAVVDIEFNPFCIAI